MKRIAMLLCMVIALGWISDTGYLSIRYDNGVGINGVPMVSGYSAIINYNGTTTTVASISPKLQWQVFRSVSVYVNGKFVQATPLGNGWLFKFNEKENTNAGRLSNR